VTRASGDILSAVLIWAGVAVQFVIITFGIVLVESFRPILHWRSRVGSCTHR
jgi:hypothetical protein